MILKINPKNDQNNQDNIILMKSIKMYIDYNNINKIELNNLIKEFINNNKKNHSIQNNISYNNILEGEISNAHISNTAAISMSKIALDFDTKIFEINSPSLISIRYVMLCFLPLSYDPTIFLLNGGIVLIGIFIFELYRNFLKKQKEL